MASAALAAARRAAAESSFERGFARGFRAGADDVGPIAWSAGYSDGWNAHTKKAKKARKRREAEARADLDAIFMSGYRDGLSDSAGVVASLKDRLNTMQINTEGSNDSHE